MKKITATHLIKYLPIIILIIIIVVGVGWYLYDKKNSANTRLKQVEMIENFRSKSYSIKESIVEINPVNWNTDLAFGVDYYTKGTTYSGSVLLDSAAMVSYVDTEHDYLKKSWIEVESEIKNCNSLSDDDKDFHENMESLTLMVRYIDGDSKMIASDIVEKLRLLQKSSVELCKLGTMVVGDARNVRMTQEFCKRDDVDISCYDELLLEDEKRALDSEEQLLEELDIFSVANKTLEDLLIQIIPADVNSYSMPRG